ncbi:MAG: hypothetical protein PUC26_01070 [Eubacteriales bacterium]|jgi:hypothetical protein|nr:hypothetical protein [Eubacteriales bacterium]
MTLLLTVFAAVIATIVWYRALPEDTYKLIMLVVMFWAASLMWLVDAIFEYAKLHAAYFTPAPAEMLNDAFLGLSVIALALVIWIVRVLISDPRKVLAKAIHKAVLRKTEKEK